jgi:hypothetical protein
MTDAILYLYSKRGIVFWYPLYKRFTFSTFQHTLKKIVVRKLIYLSFKYKKKLVPKFLHLPLGDCPPTTIVKRATL